MKILYSSIIIAILFLALTPIASAQIECHGNGLADGVIDHTDVCLFYRLRNNPGDQWAVDAAKQIRSVFLHASQGNNLSSALACLHQDPPLDGNYTGGCNRFRFDTNYPGQNHDYREIMDRSVHSKFNRSNFIFDFIKTPPEQNPGWNNRLTNLEERMSGDKDLLIERPSIGSAPPLLYSKIDGETESNPSYINQSKLYITFPHNQVDIVMFKFAYADYAAGQSLLNFFDPSNNSSYVVLDSILSASYNGRVFSPPHPEFDQVWWTAGLSKDGTALSTQFNNQMRQIVNSDPSKVLFDYADILSHRYEGYPEYNPGIAPPFDGNFEDNDTIIDGQCVDLINGNAYPALCIDYSHDSGHIEIYGGLAPAKAYWVLMASLAGWDPGSTSPPTPTPTSTSPIPTLTPIPTPVQTISYSYLIDHFGSNNPEADLNDDGIVNIFDLNLWISQ